MARESVVPRKRKLRRAEKTEANRRALVNAAAEVIGEYGYEGASISRITDRAGLAQGTFYLYFDSRQQLFDTLLPEITVEMLNAIASRVRGVANYLEVEEVGFRTFLELARKSGSLFRIISEAQVAAPKAFRAHLDELMTRYVSSLKRARKDGYLQDIDPKDFRPLAYMLIGARNYLFLHYSTGGARTKAGLEAIVETYMHVVRKALAQGRQKRT